MLFFTEKVFKIGGERFQAKKSERRIFLSVYNQVRRMKKSWMWRNSCCQMAPQSSHTFSALSTHFIFAPLLDPLESGGQWIHLLGLAQKDYFSFNIVNESFSWVKKMKRNFPRISLTPVLRNLCNKNFLGLFFEARSKQLNQFQYFSAHVW